MREHTILPTLFGVAYIAAVSICSAGDLNPPPGPVAPTQKTLTEVEPRIAVNAANTPGDANSIFRITARGSYYLTGNITGESGKHGVKIVSSGVTLDLNGFDLVGVSGALDGVTAQVVSGTNIAIKNGSIRSWPGDGVDLGSFAISGCRVEGVVCSLNNFGFRIGDAAVMTGCSAHSNILVGIMAGNGCIISNCAASSNVDGISLSSGCVISACAASANTEDGIDAGVGCTITGCTVYANISDGIQVVGDCLVQGNICDNNNGAGIHATGSDSRIEANNCTDGAIGIDVDASGNIIVRNTCSDNMTDWTIAANNVVGPILDQRAPSSAAITGFSAPSSLGSTDANANYSY